MIVRDDGDAYVLVRQADHARLSGRLAEMWGASPWQPVVDNASVLLGARLHDIAWEYWDEDPGQGDDGHPLAFHEVERVTATALYEHGVNAVSALDQYAGLLVSLHFSGFYHGHWDWAPYSTPERYAEPEATALRLFIQDQLRFQADTLTRLELTDAAAEVVLSCHYKWLQLWDRISLDLCRLDPAGGWEEEYPATPLTTAGGDPVRLRVAMVARGRCVLDPYPLRRAPYSVTVRAVRVPKSACGERAEFLAAFREADAEALQVTFEPA